VCHRGPMDTGRRTGIKVIGILGVVALIALIAFISTSDGQDVIHAFGQSCLVVHHGWHFHTTCTKT
jgi:hypothetical protein